MPRKNVPEKIGPQEDDTAQSVAPAPTGSAPTGGLGWTRGGILDLLLDVRFALRILGRNWLFTVGAVVPVAFAIGCIACSLTLVDAILFRSLGIRDPERVAAVYRYSNRSNTFTSTSYSDLRGLESLGDIVESASAFVRMPVNFRSKGATERLTSELVTAGYFQTLGIAPPLGRRLGPEDQGPGAQPVALISYAMWESRFEKNGSVLGSVAWINDVAFTIVGVMPRGYGGTLMDWNVNPSFWIALPAVRQILPQFRNLDYENLRDMQWLMIVARLRPAGSLPQFQAAVAGMAERGGSDRNGKLVALAASQARFFPGHRQGIVRILWILMAVSTAAFAIAAFNLTNLQLAHAAARRKEFGMRLALGGSRFRLLRQLTAESALLAVCACLASLPMVFVLSDATQSVQDAFGLSLDLSPDGRAIAISMLAGVATVILAGSAPAWATARIQLGSALKGPPAAWRGMSGLGARDLCLAGQVACCMTALVAASLLGRSLQNWTSLPLGYSPGSILLGSVDTLSAKVAPSDRERVYRTLLTQIRLTTPQAALAAEAMPTRVRTRLDVAPDSARDQRTTMDVNAVSDGYFALLKTQILAGRDFPPGTGSQSQPMIALNQTAAKLLYPGQNPIGRQLRIRGESQGREIVAVVSDARYRPLGEAESPAPFLFVPLFQRLPPSATIHVRTPTEPKRYAPALRSIVNGAFPGLPLSDVQPLDERVRAGLSELRLVAQSITVISMVGLTLALGGLLASAAYRVAQRQREIAIRIAVGAGPSSIIRAFAARGALIAFAGVAGGLFPAIWVSRLLRSSVAGVSSPAAALFVLSGAGLVLLSGGAFWLVARKIARLQPAQVLRVQ